MPQKLSLGGGDGRACTGARSSEKMPGSPGRGWRRPGGVGQGWGSASPPPPMLAPQDPHGTAEARITLVSGSQALPGLPESCSCPVSLSSGVPHLALCMVLG